MQTNLSRCVAELRKDLNEVQHLNEIAEIVVKRKCDCTKMDKIRFG